MKSTKLLFLGFLAAFLLGCASCVPGVCGCALSIWPDRLEEVVAIPALVSDFVGLGGMLTCGIIMLILRAKRKDDENTA